MAACLEVDAPCNLFSPPIPFVSPPLSPPTPFPRSGQVCGCGRHPAAGETRGQESFQPLAILSLCPLLVHPLACYLPLVRRESLGRPVGAVEIPVTLSPAVR